jgi:TldD protein
MLPLESVQRVLSVALQNGGDLAELYLENSEALTLNLDDGRLEQAVKGNDVGGGVRIFYGDTAVYAYTDTLDEASLVEAARAAAAAAHRQQAHRAMIDLTRAHSSLDFPIERPFNELSLTDKAAILHQMDGAARAYSPHITQVAATYNQVRRRLWIYNSDGVWAEDDRQMLEFRVHVTARHGAVRQTKSAGVGGQSGLELLERQDPLAMAQETAASAVIMLDARSAPAGEMTVVINNGRGGVLFHEACGHCLEADYINRGTSPFAQRIGQKIGPDFLTAIDDGTLPGRRGSFRFDDEGTPSQETVLIEQGILREYMWDLTEARRRGRTSTGNGRRQSFRHMPMPRMTNTYIAAGPHEPEELIRSVKKGLYAKKLGGGQVQIGSSS